jgi:hypothetical protein
VSDLRELLKDEVERRAGECLPLQQTAIALRKAASDAQSAYDKSYRSMTGAMRAYLAMSDDEDDRSASMSTNDHYLRRRYQERIGEGTPDE